MRILTPDKEIQVEPKKYDISNNSCLSIFLAGTIDNGESYNWQQGVIDNLSNCNLPNVTIYNPRRDKWEPDADEEQMFEQIKWEQKYLNECDIILMVLKSGSKSPISLLELGQFCDDNKIILCCAEEFYRLTNVKYIAQAYEIPLYYVDDVDKITEIILDTINLIGEL